MSYVAAECAKLASTLAGYAGKEAHGRVEESLES